MLWRSTGLGRTVDTVSNIIEEGNIAKGLKRTIKEDVCEDNPVGRMVYEFGHYEGKIDGYEEASQEYETKLLDQANRFLEQKTIYVNERDEYEKLLNEYELEIDILTEKANRTIEENEYLNQLLLTERKLRHLI